jgi:hypothetical protein
VVFFGSYTGSVINSDRGKKPTPQSFPQYVPNHKDNEHSSQSKEETPPSPLDSSDSEGAVTVKTPSPSW